MNDTNEALKKVNRQSQAKRRLALEKAVKAQGWETLSAALTAVMKGEAEIVARPTNPTIVITCNDGTPAELVDALSVSISQDADNLGIVIVQEVEAGV